MQNLQMGRLCAGHLTICTDKGVSVKTLSEAVTVELAGGDQCSCPPFRTLLDLNRSSTFGDPAMAQDQTSLADQMTTNNLKHTDNLASLHHTMHSGHVK